MEAEIVGATQEGFLGGCGLMRTEWKECLHGGYKFGAWDMGQYRGVECEDSRGDPGDVTMLDSGAVASTCDCLC